MLKKKLLEEGTAKLAKVVIGKVGRLVAARPKPSDGSVANAQ